MRYAFMYVLITSVVLLFLNLYAGSTTRSLTYNSKAAMLKDKVLLASTALSEQQELTADNIRQTITQMGSLNVTRILVTDETGLILYDKARTSEGQYAILPEVVKALGGNDVTYATYSAGVLETRAAAPILNSGKLKGAVYIMEYDDTAQGQLIAALMKNILWFSIILEAAVVLFSVIFSEVFSYRIRKIFASIRIIREGDYSHKMHMRGHDELTTLGEEFDALTDRLQASENRRRQFVSDASHELKTPLASIKLLSDSILQNDMDMETIREFVGDIGGEADRLTRMSQKLLSLTRMDAGQEDDRELVDVAETAERVIRMLQPVASLRSVRMETDIAPGITALMLEDDLYQILFNLTENGIKYNKEGGSLRISCRTEDDDLILDVEDTGVGIPAEAAPYIFDRFYRVDKARSRQAGGSGLGLSIVHDMVCRNYGSITMNPREGGGTIFTVTLPLFIVEEGSDAV